MRTIRAAAVLLALVAVTAGAAERERPARVVLIPAEFGVCVVTTDAKGRGRLDGYYSALADAELRRREIVRDGWITERPLAGEESQWDRAYEYGPAQILKVYVDPTLVNEPSCLPAPVPPSTTVAGAGLERAEAELER